MLSGLNLDYHNAYLIEIFASKNDTDKSCESDAEEKRLNKLVSKPLSYVY